MGTRITRAPPKHTLTGHVSPQARPSHHVDRGPTSTADEIAVEGGNGGVGAGADAGTVRAAERTVPGGYGLEALSGGTDPLSMQQTPPTGHAVPPIEAYSGCGLL